MSQVAIVILNYNGVDFLSKFLPSVINYSKGYQIIVADNASTDDSIPFLQNNYPEIKVISLDQNYGFCGGYNRALRVVDAEYYLLLNSDIEVTRNWIKPLLNLFEKDPTIAVVQPKILSHSDKTRFEYAGAAGGYMDKYGYPFCRGRIFNSLEKDAGQYDLVHEIFWASGACMLIKAKNFWEADGFDEKFFAHMEEIDLCWRLKNLGYRIMYSPGSKVYHVGGGTLPKNNPKKIFLNFRNSLFMLVKNLPSNRLFSKLLVRMVLDLPAAIMFILQGSPKNFMMVFKAHMDFYRNLPDFLNDKLENQRSLKSFQGYYPKSIVYQYFIKRKKVFSKL